MRIVTLGEVADWGSGGTPKRSVSEYFGDGVPWLSIADLNDGTVASAKESLTPAGVANSSAKVVPAGTLFIAMYGSIGKLAIAGREMATSQAIAFAKPKEDLIDRRFLFHFLLAQRPKLQAMGRGGTQKNIGQTDLKAWPIFLPPLPEQRRIAAILDHADTLRTKRRQVLARLDSLTQSIFNDMFAMFHSQTEFGSVIEAGPSNGMYRPASDYGDGVPILRIDTFSSGAVLSDSSHWKRLRADASDIRRYSLRAGDLVINRVNALSHLGKSALIASIDEPSVYESNMMRIRVNPDLVCNDFILAWLQTEHTKVQMLRKAKKAINQASINQTDVRSLLLPLPPLDVQHRFAERGEAVNTERTIVNRALAADNELFGSLQSRAFRGDL